MRKNANCPQEIVDDTAKNICSSITAAGNTVAESLLQRQVSENVLTHADALRYLASSRHDIDLIVEPLSKLTSEYGRVKYLKVKIFFLLTYLSKFLGYGLLRYPLMQSCANKNQLSL